MRDIICISSIIKDGGQYAVFSQDFSKRIKEEMKDFQKFFQMKQTIFLQCPLNDDYYYIPFSFRAERFSSEVLIFCFFAGGRSLVDSELESELESELLELSSEDDDVDDCVVVCRPFFFALSFFDSCFPSALC